MPIKGAVIKTGATVSQTGGTDATYSTAASSGPGVLTVDNSVTDARLRPSSLFLSRPAVLGSDGDFGKGKVSAIHRRPVVGASGSYKYPLMRVEFEDYPGLTAAERQAFWDWLAQLCVDADYANFRNYGSLD
jgi:hypothetical protein